MNDAIEKSSLHVEYQFPIDVSGEGRRLREYWVQRIASCMKARHPEMQFSHLDKIIFTKDARASVSEIEKSAGFELPSGRNGAENMAIFYFEVGATRMLVVNDDWAELMQGTAEQRSVGAWMMAERLASLDFHARLQAKFSNDQWLAQASPSGMRFFKYAREMLGGYASGFGSHLAEYDCLNPFFELAESVEKDIPELIRAMSDHLDDKDFDRFEARLCESSKYLFQAMVIAIGYCDAAGRPLASTAPVLWAELSRNDLDKLWAELASTCRHGHATWEDSESAFDLIPIATKVWLDFLETLGLRYQVEDDAIVGCYVPLPPPVSH